MTKYTHRKALLCEEERLARAVLEAYSTKDKEAQKQARIALTEFNKKYDYRARKNK